MSFRHIWRFFDIFDCFFTVFENYRMFVTLFQHIWQCSYSFFTFFDVFLQFFDIYESYITVFRHFWRFFDIFGGLLIVLRNFGPFCKEFSTCLMIFRYFFTFFFHFFNLFDCFFTAFRHIWIFFCIFFTFFSVVLEKRKEICHTVLAIHKSYPDRMRLYWGIYEKENKNMAYYVPPTSYNCRYPLAMDYMVWRNKKKWFSEPKLCKDHPTWKRDGEIEYKGRQGFWAMIAKEIL